LETGCTGDALQAYILWPPQFCFSLNLFILFFSGSIFLALITNGDGSDEIFGACCGGVASIGAQSDGAVDLLRVILVAVIGDCGAFGLGLLQLGFSSPTSVAFSVFAAW
jgi:hypothetical protein